MNDRRGLPAELAVALDRGAPEPLAVQVAVAVRAAAGSGHLRVGDRVPATRALAAELGVSRTVTAAAYDQLVAEGWLGPRRGSGTFVLAAPTATPRENARPAEPAEHPRTGEHARPAEPAEHPRTAEHARAAGSAEPAALVHDLRPGAPCLEVLDRSAWRRAWRTAGDRDPAARPEHAGTPAFRRAVADLLLRHRGMPAGPEAVLATAGTTDGFAEVVAVLAGWAGRPLRVGVEDPGYGRAVGVLRAAGAEVVGLPVDDDGLIVDAVPDGLDAVYTTPAHHYPLGARLSVGRRVALVARARAEGLLVVEDDYDGELRYDVAPLSLLAALAPDVVVHLGTTSKVLSPTLGAGWCVAPPELHAALLARRRVTGVRPSPAGQHVVAALAADGSFGRHLARLRRELAARRRDVVDAVHAAGRTVVGDLAGAHLVVPLPDAATESAAVAAGGARGLALGGLAPHHLGAPTVHGVLVGWAAPTGTRMPVALDLLRGALSGVAPVGAAYAPAP